MTTRKEQNNSKWRNRLASWYKSANRVFKLVENIKASKSEDSKDSVSMQEKDIRKDLEDFERYINEVKEQTNLNVDADKLANAIRTFQFFEAKLFEREGYTDGLRGSKDRNVEASAYTRASYIYGHCNAALNGRIKGLQTDLDAKESEESQLDIEIQKEKTFYSEMDNLRKEEHRNFSWVLSLLYILVGMALMFADFPVSIGISNYFIDMPFGQNGNFWRKMSNPETLLFSLGITFLSIYYKIIYDEYINVSIINKRKSVADTSAGDYIRNIIRLIIKLLILVSLLWLLYNIGHMRNALNVVPITPPKSNEEFVLLKDVFFYKLTSFIFTTILLPLISGICLSVGFNIFANRRNLKRSKKMLKALKKQRNELGRDIISLKTVKFMLDTLYTEWNTQMNKISHLKELFVNSYKRGFNRAHSAKYDDVYIKAFNQYLDHLNYTHHEKN